MLTIELILLILLFGSLTLFLKPSKTVGLFISLITFGWTVVAFILFNSNSCEIMRAYALIEEVNIDGINFPLIVLIGAVFPVTIILTNKKECTAVLLLVVTELLLLCTLMVQELLKFFIFFELSVVPIFLLILYYGSHNKLEAIKKYYLYSFFSAILLLFSIVFIYFTYGTTNIELLLIKHKTDVTLIWLGLAIFLANKLPMFPLHNWLPVAHSEANTVGSMILAAILLKLGSFGILKYLLQLNFNSTLKNYLIVLSILSIIYSSLSALREIDFKRFIAHTSIVHMNYFILSVFSGNVFGLAGSYYLMISHGIVSAVLFLLVGILYKRFNTRIIYYYFNLITCLPLLSFIFLISFLNLISLPLTSPFVSELLIVSSLTKTNPIVGILSIMLLIINSIYSFSLIFKIFYGKMTFSYIKKFKDLTILEILISLLLILLSFFLGINSSFLIKMINLSIYKLNLLI